MRANGRDRTTAPAAPGRLRASPPRLPVGAFPPACRAGTASVIPQLYAGLSKGGHVAVALGVELPITDEAWDYRLRSFLLWDIADGPFWKGW